MLSLNDLYQQMLERAAANNRNIVPDGADPAMVSILMNPDEYGLVVRTKPCICSGDKKACVDVCDWDAMTLENDGSIRIDDTQCVGCQACIDACKFEVLTTKKDLIPVVNDLHNYEGPVYALVAPAFSGQFGSEVSAGKLRSALKKLGFTDMIEVAIFADVLTLKEALEFTENISDQSAFQLTSCCCPMWISMIKKKFHELLPNVPGSVSPMIAGGRTVKALHPNAKTVFIGPCMAKKAESKDPDLAGAIDYVLTYQELQDLFSVTDIDLENQEEESSPHASRTGIGYAYSGGVAEAVELTVKALNQGADITFESRTADGVPDCKALIEDILAGNRQANFFEGMGCRGGCVGGPKAIRPKEEGKEAVRAYGKESRFETPMENLYLIELLNRLGFSTIEEFLQKSDLYDRIFD